MTPDYIHVVSEISGILTILLSIFGGIMALAHVRFFRQSNKKLANKVKLVFFSDAMIYVVTAFFGLWAFFEWSYETAIGFHILRIPILCLNIYASYRLYTHYKNIK